MNNTTIIKLKDLRDYLNNLNIKQNEEVCVKHTASSITIRINSNNSRYQPIAKCGKYTARQCIIDWKNNPDCINCSLINRRTRQLYKFINGHKYKRCPRCKKYHPIELFKINDETRQYSSWCNECKKEYNRIYNRTYEKKSK